MAAFIYLWKNRARFPVNSTAFYRAWGKRMFSFQEVLRRNIRRKRLIKAGARIHPTAEVGKMVIGGHRNKLFIGAFSFVGEIKIALHESVFIGERVCINDGVQIFTASHDVLDPKWGHKKDKVIIEDYAWIGTGAMILPGVQIGKGAVVGAGAVVSKSVPAYSIVVGNPAKVISKSRNQNLNYNPCEFLAENKAWIVG